MHNLKTARVVAASVTILIAAGIIGYFVAVRGFSNPSSGSSTSTTHSITGSRIRHVIIIVMENKGYDQVVGSSSAPYENLLISRYALAANYNAVSHPSLPNYFALVAGDTFGVTNDCQPSQCSLPNASMTNLLDSHGLSWREYAESMPVNCSQSPSQDGLYVPRHNPFVYFSTITNNTGSGVASQYCNTHVVPFTQFSNDLQSSTLPSFALITPNICNDGHDCDLSTGDGWLSTVIARIIGSSSFSSTALFVVYDEGSGSGTNSPSHVVCVLVSPFAKPGYSSNTRYSHYSLLATVEAIFSVGNLGRNDSTAGTMSDLFTINLSSASGY